LRRWHGAGRRGGSVGRAAEGHGIGALLEARLGARLGATLEATAAMVVPAAAKEPAGRACRLDRLKGARGGARQASSGDQVAGVLQVGGNAQGHLEGALE
jgi:hypothetical protein